MQDPDQEPKSFLPTDVIGDVNTVEVVETVKSGLGLVNNIFFMICLAFLVVGIIIMIINFKSEKDKKNNAITPTVSVSVTNTATPTTTSALNTFTSDDLQISFTIPDGYIVKEVVSPYNPDGCISEDKSAYNSYKAVHVYDKTGTKDVLFIGVNPDCGASPAYEGFTGAQVKFTKTIAGVTYKMFFVPEFPNDYYFRTPVQFGTLSKVKLGITGSNDAMMIPTSGKPFTEKEFNDMLSLIISIKPL